ncbi:MAG: hypothetical protein EPO06_06855 [Burkholderiaceae bacterium]|nr:MAG: hypothetical protein EPO06_06855 [Burkholderiaceae bacterium]
MFASAVRAEEPAPAEGGFFGKLGNAVKKGISDGVDNGVQMSGSVKVLGYTMIYSNLARSDQPAFCLANADTGKLITVAPVFGRPFQRADGTTGFTQMAQPVDAHHSKIEVNVAHVLPGLNCADLVAKHGLNPYAVSGRMGNSGASESVPGKVTAASELEFSDCYGRYLEPAEKAQVSKAPQWRESDGHKLCLNKVTGRPQNILNFTTHHLEDLPKGFTTVTGLRADGSAAPQENVQAGWNKVDQTQREGMAKNEADSAARQSASADQSMLRKAAYEKCKPLIGSDNSKMEAFKSCYNNALK